MSWEDMNQGAKSQSIQSARLSVQSSALDPQAPSPASEWCSPTLGPRGGLTRGKGRGTHFRQRDKGYSMYVYYKPSVLAK
jgi:hypothetical protein